MRHQLTNHKCEIISDCSYSGKTLVEKRLFPEVMEVDKDFDPFHVTLSPRSPGGLKICDDIFKVLEPQAGMLSEEKVRNYWKNHLPMSVSCMDKIWSLSDQNGDGCLDRYEWTLFNHLAQRAGDYGYPIPDQVVISLIS